MVFRQFSEPFCTNKIILVFPHKDYQCRYGHIHHRQTGFALLRHFRTPFSEHSPSPPKLSQIILSATEITAEENWVYFFSVDTSSHTPRPTTEHHIRPWKPGTSPNSFALLVSTLHLFLHHHRPQAVLLSVLHPSITKIWRPSLFQPRDLDSPSNQT